MPGVAVVFPVDPATALGVGDRGPTFEWVAREIEAAHPDWMILVGATASGDPWCKAAAVTDALSARDAADADVLVVHDADVLVPPFALRDAVSAVERGARWAVPHQHVHRLDSETTGYLMIFGAFPDRIRLVRPPYVGVLGGGVTVLRRDVYDEAPIDRRICGWGSEDECWGWALETLFGPPWRGDAALLHLFHPHPEPGARRNRDPEVEMLRRAYRYARSSGPEQMRAVLAGTR